MAEAILNIENLSFTYPDGTPALRDINLEVHPNELLVIFGPSRSGKTTLLRLLNRLSDQIEGARRHGKILFHGQDIFARNVHVPYLRRRISMVFATPTPLPGSIMDNMSYGLKMAGQRDSTIFAERTEHALRQASLIVQPWPSGVVKNSDSAWRDVWLSSQKLFYLTILLQVSIRFPQLLWSNHSTS
jgi:phosphate transport system ATP-binding protein